MKPLKLISSLGSVLFLGSLLTVMNCGTDSSEIAQGNGVDPIEVTVQIDDPDQVTEAIAIAGATITAGAPPVPTTDAGTPEITNNDIAVTSSQDGAASITLNINAESVSGFYFQINGASSYLDIPFSSGGRIRPGGRILIDETATLEIDLIEGFEPGTFCGVVCAYDEVNRVSQPITICIEVIELGGENSAFIVGSWILTAVKNDDGDIINVGVLDEYPNTLQCSDGTSVTVTEGDRIDFLTASFSSLGAAVIDGQEYEKELDFNVSTCDNIVFIEEEDIIDLDGIWTYDDAAKELDMVLQNNEDNEQEVIRFSVVQNGVNIELTFLDQDTETLYFSPK
jgi:hypothetical protein